MRTNLNYKNQLLKNMFIYEVFKFKKINTLKSKYDDLIFTKFLTEENLTEQIMISR